jgi:hypothetical protein
MTMRLTATVSTRRKSMCQRLSGSVIVLSVMFFVTVVQADTARLETPDVGAVVGRVWNEEYSELAGQIARLKNWNGVPRDRLREEALDEQALTLSEDKDPLDIVLRRTTALLQHFREKGRLDSSWLGGFETQLNELSTSAESTSNIGDRKTLFIEVCKLRRDVAMANPLPWSAFPEDLEPEQYGQNKLDWRRNGPDQCTEARGKHLAACRYRPIESDRSGRGLPAKLERRRVIFVGVL